jgi:hypothetical protein
MAFLVQHGKSRAAVAAAAARGRKPRHGTRAAAAAKSPTKPRQLAGRLLLAACLLAPVLCICAARLVSPLSSRVSCESGITCQINQLTITNSK